MSLLRRLYFGQTHFDFVGRRRWWFALSAVLVLISALALGIRGLNLSVDFVGGSLVECDNPAGASVADVRNALTGIGQSAARVQLSGGGAGVRVQTGELTEEAQDQLIATVAAVAGVTDLNQVSYQTVGPTFGRQVTESAVRALVVFLIVVAVFLWWRLEWRMALIALLEVLHDLVLTAGIYSLVGFEVTPATVIAVLTILGYSLYDTVVVFDKVHENVAERGERHTISALVNMSVNQVLMRSINTSLTTLLPVGSLLFVGSLLLGATTLREFALGLFVGVAAGTYSSMFLGSPLVAEWKEREEHWQRIRRRLGRKGAEDEFAARELEVLPEEEAAAFFGGDPDNCTGSGSAGASAAREPKTSSPPGSWKCCRRKRRPRCCRPPPGRCPAPRASAAVTAEAPRGRGLAIRGGVQFRDDAVADGRRSSPAPGSRG